MSMFGGVECDMECLWLKDMVKELIQNTDWDEECETKHGLKEAYGYIPRSALEKILKETTK
jgi:hypothetical protein